FYSIPSATSHKRAMGGERAPNRELFLLCVAELSRPVIVAHPNCRCPLWVKSGHVQRTSRCPLHPRKPPDVTNPPVFSTAGPKLLLDDCELPNADAERADTNSGTTRSAVISVARTIARIVATTIARIVAITVITLRIWIC